jgi:formylglycine-generating enzyme required for sulfatase activity
MEMRGGYEYDKIVQEAELMAMTPQAVADFLMKRADQIRSKKIRASTREWAIDEDTERSLRSRADPLIDLCLARYGTSIEIVADLFRSSPPSSPLRLACLSNSTFDCPDFPDRLFHNEHECHRLLGAPPNPEPMLEWAASASREELRALFVNPALSSDFLERFLGYIDNRGECRGGDAIISEVDLYWIFIALAENPRLGTPINDDDSWSLDASSVYNAPFKKAWLLAEIVPTSERWASALGHLYSALPAECWQMKNPLKVAERWHVDPNDLETAESSMMERKMGDLSDWEKVRRGLAKLALRQESKLLCALLTHNDIAFRAAAYAYGNLRSEQLQAGYEKDGTVAVCHALSNLSLWARRDTRLILHQLAWEADKNYSSGDLLNASEYCRRERCLREKHPDWFTDDDAEQSREDDTIDNQQSATKGDILSLSAQLDHQAQTIGEIEQKLDALMGNTKWLWWFLLGALAAKLLSSGHSEEPRVARGESGIAIPAQVGEMVLLKGGVLPSESPLSGQEVSDFWIGKYEVTWGEWKVVREWAAGNGYDLSGVGEGSGDDHPVRNVNWYQAVKWCNARSEKEGKTPVYRMGVVVYRTGKGVPTVNESAMGYRLPLEKEWEWAARGGVHSKRYAFSGGDDLSKVGWIGENRGTIIIPAGKNGGNGPVFTVNSLHPPLTWPVGKKKANELGLYDMSGNVWEWCFDAVFEYRVHRGGGWNDRGSHCTVARKGNCSPTISLEDGGFRLASSSVQYSKPNPFGGSSRH